jgi:ADP-heptose:LPS heptosyltransferase/SAM-dependent methyltransferase
MRRLVLRSFQSPGDVVMLTAAVRDLHAANPGVFQTDVRTTALDLWANNPHVTPLAEGAPGVEVLEMHYPLIHQSNTRPYHFIHGYTQYLEERLGVRVPLTRFQGDIHLTDAERLASIPGAELGLQRPYWIMMAGGKFDFTAKWWNPAFYQAVVDHFRGRIQFVQCGEAGHWHPPLEGVVNLVGKTATREFVRLMYHADGVVCPVTFAMHLAAAVPTPPGRFPHRPCVVIAGGREPAQWEAYPHHQYLGTNGALPCCAEGGCWKSRCQTVGDGDAKDRDLCVRPVAVSPQLNIPQCMHMITPADVIRRIELYYDGGALTYRSGGNRATTLVSNGNGNGNGHAPTQSKQRVLLEFRHGLGDAVQLTIVLRHLQSLKPDWSVDVAALPGKVSAFTNLCANTRVLDSERLDRTVYDQVLVLDWHECRTGYADVPSTKPSRCLLEVFGLKPVLDLCGYRISIGDSSRDKAHAYLAQLCPAGPRDDGRYPVVLLHYQGNTSGERKNLTHELAREVCQVVGNSGFVPIVLDWDHRSPLIDQRTVFSPGKDHPLWNGMGTGDAEALAALIELSTLFVGIDSGPLHVAGATSTPTIGVWTGHHPGHFFDLSDNVMHLVPGDHVAKLPNPEAVAFFQKHYHHTTYKQLTIELPAVVQGRLTGEGVEQIANRRFLNELSSRAYDAVYYEEHKLAGLDYLGYGEWQEQYGDWLTSALAWKERRVLDIGCACGSILRGLGHAGAIVQGVEINEHMVRLGREKWPDMAGLLHVCDAVNLHLFADGAWEGLHSAQVAEHWKPQLVQHILEELRRVTATGGLFFCALDTEELFARQGRDLAHEDPTHICIKPLAWWHEQLRKAGWQLCGEQVEHRLRSHPGSFLKRYDWDWFVARAV